MEQDFINIRSALLTHLDEIHTTQLGEERISRNLQLRDCDIIEYCKDIIANEKSTITGRGKNYYVRNGTTILTINAHSFTVITAHLSKSVES